MDGLARDRLFLFYTVDSVVSSSFPEVLKVPLIKSLTPSYEYSDSPDALGRKDKQFFPPHFPEFQTLSPRTIKGPLFWFTPGIGQLAN